MPGIGEQPGDVRVAEARHAAGSKPANARR